MKVLILNGPNLNLLGQRQPEIYGDLTLQQIRDYTLKKFAPLPGSESFDIAWFQSNHEGVLIDKVHEAFRGQYDALIINPAGYSHTSVALLDALLALKVPVVEVHLSNVHEREDFRSKLLTGQAASIIMSGLGKDAYYSGLKWLLERKDHFEISNN